ncbi:SMPD4 [Bugula neritina]|uniref:SMPD4 n=1 Tax=Bugula neritina TaxID=10212 RepID=A0A7J7JAJ1_BUGNE|nr:SMPD4 [Bugula neritina]
MSSYLLNSSTIKREDQQLHDRDIFYDSVQQVVSPSSVQRSSNPIVQQSGAQSTRTPSSDSIEQALLKPSYHEKCQALTSALSGNLNIRNIQHQYSTIVQKIFGFGQYPPGWRIEVTHKLKSKRDSDAILAFLHPTGPLFTHVIYKLLAEAVVFEFPYNCLPGATKKRVEERLPLPELYNGKLVPGHTSQPVVLLDAFEYYFFVFAHKMVSSSTKAQELYLEPSDWLYPTLLDTYLQYFLPKTGIPDAVPNLPVSLGLLKQTTPQFSRSLSSQHHTQDSNVDGDIMWRSERIVQILAEFWMGQTSLDLSTSTDFRFAASPGETLPSHDLIMLVRMLIKHLHMFVNTCDSNPLPSHQQNAQTTLGSLKKLLVPRYIQKPLYAFLKHSIEKWPLDTSFRPILETWLTFIQPWRYTVNATGSGDESKINLDDFMRLWEGFVRPNSLFYTVILQDVLSRFSRIDMSSSKMAFQLHRVCKVLNIDELMSILKDVDVSVSASLYPYPELHTTGLYTTGYGDLTEGHVGDAQSLLFSQISNLESPLFDYRPLFSDEVLYQVRILLQEMANAHLRVKTLKQSLQSKQSANQNSSILSFIGLGTISEFNDAQTSADNKEYSTAEKWLETSIADLSNMLRLPVPEAAACSSTESMSGSGSDTLPDHIAKADGRVELTALGRYQVLNGLRKFQNIEYQCDPELQPVRSYESDVGVIQLYKLSCAINKKYGEWFAQQCDNDGLIGYIARRLLNKPSKSSSTLSRYPRLSLRFMANYYLLGYGFLGYLVMSSAMGRLPAVVIATVLFLLYIVIMAAVDMARGTSWKD